jgi:hypothetical protein
MLTAPEFGTLNRYAGGKCCSQLRAVRFAPCKPVTVGRQARTQTVLLWKVSQQLLQVGNREG